MPDIYIYISARGGRSFNLLYVFNEMKNNFLKMKVYSTVRYCTCTCRVLVYIHTIQVTDVSLSSFAFALLSDSRAPVRP